MEQSLNISVVAGIVLSLIFEYIPGVSGWYDALDKRQKQGVMAIALLVVTLAVFGLACVGWFNTGVSCDVAGIQQLIALFVAALVANQSTYLITRKE